MKINIFFLKNISVIKEKKNIFRKNYVIENYLDMQSNLRVKQKI